METINNQAVIDEATPQDAVLPIDTSVEELKRLEAIDEYAKPYHIHFVEGAEGHALNPEAAEYNFDAQIMLTQLMHEKCARTGTAETVSDWFYSKYPDSDIDRKQLKKPSSVVRTWLKKLGPHNDMSEAEGDLLFARSWMLSTEAGRRQSDRDVDYSSKEFRLVADIDLELANIIDDELREQFLEEAAEFLKYSADEHLNRGNFGYASLDLATLTSVKIELARHRIFGTGQLINSKNNELYEELETTVNSEIATLESVILQNIDKTLQNIVEVNGQGDTIDKINRDNLAVMLEAATYYMFLTDMVEKKALSAAKIRFGTIREEQGETNTVINSEIDNNTGKTKNFNFNFDLAYTQLTSKKFGEGVGLYETTYIQNKTNPKDADQEKAMEYSDRFIAGKRFIYVTPQILMNLEVPEEHATSQRAFMEYYAKAVKKYISKL
jgi:hypothetical protein